MADQSGNGKAGKKGPSGRSYRNATGLTRQPKKMRGRKVSSQRWLTRQLNDPFVAEAKSRDRKPRDLASATKGSFSWRVNQRCDETLRPRIFLGWRVKPVALR